MDGERTTVNKIIDTFQIEHFFLLLLKFILILYSSSLFNLLS